MRPLDSSILEYLKTQRIGVLALRMPDGTPHAATVHFAYDELSSIFIFQTSPTYRKVEAVKNGETTASFVVGVDEGYMKTLQLDGMAQLVDTETIKEAYLNKFPEKRDKHPDNVFITFTASWWRFTDWTGPDGKKITSSELD